MEPPLFPASGLHTVRAAPGSPASLVLPIPAGTPPFHFTWSRAGASLDERFTSTDDAGGVRLTVSAARTGDTDVYTLQARNAAGTDSTRVRLEVSSDEAPTGEDPPNFLRRLQDLTVKVGTRTRFLVEIVSSTECKVTWYRNERRLLEAERVSLARDGNFWCADVAAVSVDDAGRWTCTAENAGGRASCSAHLNVLVPKAYKRPEFVEELRALLTEQGTVSLECKVVGVPTPILRWFKDSREIKAGDVFALTANAEDPTSLGTYTCEAVNCMGRAYSSSKVHVVGRGSREGSSRPSSSLAPEPPPIFTKELEDQFVRITEPLTLSCHIVVPPWPRSVVWYNKEGKIEPGERYHVLEDGAGGYLLEIPSAEWPDEGEWKCVACSSGGRVGISTCYVTMDVPKNYRKPRFMENLQAVLTEEGLVSFECKVVGFPTPVLSWFKDGQELKPGDVYQLTGTNSLGSYCCIARNCMGQASSSAELTVEDIQNQLNEEEKHQLFQAKNQAPKFIQGLKSVEAKIDEPFRFTVKVAIPPEPSVLWYRDDQPVDESSRCHHGKEDRGVFYLDIQTLEFLDQAEWKCVAMNDFGHSVTSCFLKLNIPRHYKKPRFLENLQAILSDEGAVNLECKVIGVPQPVLKWYKDGEELKPGDIHRIISGQDGTCCLGTYTCEAQNCMGIAASSASLLGFDDSMKAKKKKAEEQALQRNLSLSTIHEERTSQMYDTPVGDITLNDDKGEISFSFDGKEVSVSLYETPDLTEEEALQIVEMYADQLSENITEHNVVELPPLRFVKETSTSGNLLMEAVIIDVSPDYFQSPDEDLRTEADVEDISIADENAASLLSLDQDDIGGEDYLEKTMALLSEEKSDIPLKSSRKKSDSQRSADDFFSLSRDQSLSEDKKDDDTQPISESDMPSFASAHSSSKPKSKSSKPSGDDGQESSEPTKTILFKDEAKKLSLEVEPSPVVKPKRERRSSRGSRRSSSGSEKSVSKSREEALRKLESIEMEAPKKPSMSEDEFKQKMTNISTYLSKVINDVQIIERDIILKSELMSSAATASRSLEIISSLISPLSEIHSIADATKEAISESKEVSSTLFNSLPQPLKVLQQSLTIIEKCIDMESDSKTLVKKTCVAFIENCGKEMQLLISEINDVTSKDYLTTEDRILTEIESINNEMSTVIKFSSETIKARNLISEANDIKVDEPSQEVKHLRDTQRAVFELKSPLNSLLCIAESADSGKIVDVTNSDVILNDMSGSIQDLQAALEQIESLSVKEASTSLHKYNTEIIETVMESVVKLRTSFEQLSTETKSEDKLVLKQAITSIKENLNKISSQINAIETNVGTFDVLASDNKLDALQKMAQILIALENNLPRLEPIPVVKNHMTAFHKDLTKVLENVIESNESKKYFALMEICDGVNRINASVKNLDVDPIIPLASFSNTLRIIQDQFVNNVFDSELNCSILTNISETIVGIQEAINTADEISMHIDSEHIQDISSKGYNETKAKVIVEHIEHTIAAIENVRAIESTQELKLNIAPTLENICPVLEELKRSVAAIKASGVDEEHISDISEVSFAQTLATPLCELNQNIMVLNQQIVENIENMKDNSEIISTVAEPLHELYTTLEILQQDVISQYGEDVTPYDISINMASAVQNLQSCIVMIQDQAAVEGADEMSTLEDISGIKTTADTIPSDRLVLPTAEETAIEQALSPYEQETQTTAAAQALQTLNEHITVLQTPEIMDALDTLSEISDYSSLKYFVAGLSDLHTGIEEIFHPIVMEGSNEITNLINPAKLTAIAEPMQELQQSLSVLDTSNIPIYENILEMPTEKIHSVIQSVSEFKEHLDRCMLAVFPATQTTDNTVEIANKVGNLREVCEQLKAIFEYTKNVECAPVPKEIKALELTVDNLLDATDVSKGIKIDQVKTITEQLYEKVITVQEEMIQFTPQPLEKLIQEAKLIQTIDEVQSNIAVLEQYDFVDLSRASEISCTSPQMAVELESDSLVQIGDIVDNAVNIVQDAGHETPLADLMIIEDFFKTCKNEFTILRCLISKATSHKKIIRLLQEFSCLQSTIVEFKNKRIELNLSDDINACLATFLIHADDCLENVQTSLVKILNSQADLLIEAPLAKFENSARLIEEVTKSQKNIQVNETVVKFSEILHAAKPILTNVKSDILEELKNACYVGNDNVLVDKIEEFATFVEQTKSQTEDDTLKDILDKVSTCIEKHQDYKDANGTGKTLIIIKCLSDCTDILQENLLKISIVKQKVEEGALKAVLSEILEPLQALHTQLTDVQEQVLGGVDEDSISVDIATTESLVQTMTEKHKKIIEKIESEPAVANEEISLIMEVDKEIHSIQDSLKSIENVQVAQIVKEIAKPVEEIEKSLHIILSSEKVTHDKLHADVNSNIDSLENALSRFLSIGVDSLHMLGIFNNIEIVESVKIATELKNILALNPNDSCSSSIIGNKYDKIKSLKDILSTFDWKNTELYEGKEIVETDKLKHIFLATYQLLAELDKVDKLESIQVNEEKAKQIIHHLDQYIELIEIVEEISAVIRIEDVKETMDLAKELRESIATSDITTDEEVRPEKVIEKRIEQARLAQQLQTALSALQVQVIEGAQELAPALSTEVLQRIVKVTSQLQADLVAVTGVHVALQAPAELVSESIDTVLPTERQIVSMIAPDVTAVASSTEAIAVEQKGLIEQQIPSEHLITSTENLEEASVVPEEIVTSKEMQPVPTEIAKKIGETLRFAAIQEIELVAAHETKANDDVTEANVEHDITTAVSELDSSKDSATDVLEKPPIANIDTLIQHIDQYISEDITEVITELSNVVNAEEMKQSINIAKELRESIVVSEVELKAETSGVLKEEANIQQAQLAHQLQTALAAFENLPIDSLEQLSGIDKYTLEKVAVLTENLRTDLATVCVRQDVIDQVEETKLEQVVPDTTKPQIIELGSAEATTIIKQSDVVSDETVSVEPIVTQVEESMTEEIEVIVDDIQVQPILDKNITTASETIETPLEIAGTTLIETITVAPSSTEVKIVDTFENIAVSQDVEPVPIISEQSTHTEKEAPAVKALEKLEEPLVTATAIDTLLQNLNEFLSDNVLQTVQQISATLKVDELYQAVAAAQELFEYISATNILSPKSDLIQGSDKLVDAQEKFAHKLLNHLSIIQVLVTDGFRELATVVEPGALEQATVVVASLSSILATLSPKSIKDQTLSNQIGAQIAELPSTALNIKEELIKQEDSSLKDTEINTATDDIILQTNSENAKPLDAEIIDFATAIGSPTTTTKQEEIISTLITNVAVDENKLLESEEPVSLVVAETSSEVIYECSSETSLATEIDTGNKTNPEATTTTVQPSEAQVVDAKTVIEEGIKPSAEIVCSNIPVTEQNNTDSSIMPIFIEENFKQLGEKLPTPDEPTVEFVAKGFDDSVTHIAEISDVPQYLDNSISIIAVNTDVLEVTKTNDEDPSTITIEEDVALANKPINEEKVFLESDVVKIAASSPIITTEVKLLDSKNNNLTDINKEVKDLEPIIVDVDNTNIETTAVIDKKNQNNKELELGDSNIELTSDMVIAIDSTNKETTTTHILVGVEQIDEPNIGINEQNFENNKIDDIVEDINKAPQLDSLDKDTEIVILESVIEPQLTAISVEPSITLKKSTVLEQEELQSCLEDNKDVAILPQNTEPIKSEILTTEEITDQIILTKSEMGPDELDKRTLIELENTTNHKNNEANITDCNAVNHTTVIDKSIDEPHIEAIIPTAEEEPGLEEKALASAPKESREDNEIEHTEVFEVITPSEATITIDSLQVTVIIENLSEDTLEAMQSSKAVIEHGNLVGHLDNFVSEEISSLVDQISVLTHSEQLKETVALAQQLKESLVTVNIEETGSLKDTQVEQAQLVQVLHDALCVLHAKALENADEVAMAIKPAALQQVSDVISQLQEDLKTATVSGQPEILKSAEIVELPEQEENSMKQLEVLLQEVTDKINVASVSEADGTESLKDTLDEVQTVIIKLKHDYDGAANDTLNETLEDLECSVRSVQLQINEDSPPELLKEACATLQLLVNNMNETQEVCVAEVAAKATNETILEKCSVETDETIKLLELASKIELKDSNLSGIISGLTILKDTIKGLKLSFTGNTDVLIEIGVEITQSLDLLEEKVFSLERDLSDANISTNTRDSILTAVHSVFGSISNMRGTISSVQKRYMFENYGKPSEVLLRSIKNITVIAEASEKEKQQWKLFSKSLRKVLNHFEDIKFYINFDKTARLPGDAAFTKIILEELKSNIGEILIPQVSILGPEGTLKTTNLLESINKSLLSIESNITLEVKKKIPIFKEVSSQLYNVTEFIKNEMEKQINEPAGAVQNDEDDKIGDLNLLKTVPTELLEFSPTGTVTDSLSQDKESRDNLADISTPSLPIEEIAVTEPSTSTVQETAPPVSNKIRKKVRLQETSIELQIEQIASDFVSEIASEALARVQAIEEIVDKPANEPLILQTEKGHASPKGIDAITEPNREESEKSPVVIPQNMEDLPPVILPVDKQEPSTSFQDEMQDKLVKDKKQKVPEIVAQPAEEKEERMMEQIDTEDKAVVETKDSETLQLKEDQTENTNQSKIAMEGEKGEVIKLKAAVDTGLANQENLGQPQTGVEELAEGISAEEDHTKYDEKKLIDQPQQTKDQVKQNVREEQASTEPRIELKQTKVKIKTEQDRAELESNEKSVSIQSSGTFQTVEEKEISAFKEDDTQDETESKVKTLKEADVAGSHLIKEEGQFATQTEEKEAKVTVFKEVGEKDEVMKEKEEIKVIVKKDGVEIEAEVEEEAQTEDQVKKEKEETVSKAKKEKEAKASANKVNEEVEGKTKKENERVEAKAKKEKEESEANVRKGKTETEDYTKKEAEDETKKEKEEVEAKAKKEKEQAEAKSKKQKEEDEAKTKNEAEKAKAKKVKEESEAQANNEAKETEAKKEKKALAEVKTGKEEAEMKVKKDKEKEDAKIKGKGENEEAATKVKREKEEAETKAKKEKEAPQDMETKEKEEVESKVMKKQSAETVIKIEAQEAEASLKKEQEESDTKAKREKEVAEMKSKIQVEEAKIKAIKESVEAESKTIMEKEEAEAKTKQEKEEAEAKSKRKSEAVETQVQEEKENLETNVVEENEDAEAKEKKEAEQKTKKEAEEKAIKEKGEADVKAQTQKEKAEVKAIKEKEEAEAKAKKEKEEAEVKAIKDKEKAETKAKTEKKDAKVKATKEEEEAEAKAKKEEDKAEAEAKKEKEEAEAKAMMKKAEGETKIKREKEEAEAKAMKEKEAAETKAKKEKEEAEAKEKNEKEEAETKVNKEKEEAEVKIIKEKEETEVKAKKEKEEAKVEAKIEKEEAEVKAKKEKEEAKAQATKEKEEDKAKEKKEVEVKAMKEKEEAETKAKKEKEEAKARKEKEEAEAKTKKEKEEAEAKAKKEKEEAEAKAKKEKEEAEAKAKKEKEEAEAKAKKEKEETEAKAKKEKEETEVKAKKEKEEAEAKSKKENEEAKAKKEKEEAEARAKKEKEEAEAKAKKEAEANAKKEKEEAEANAKKEKEDAEAKAKQEKEEAEAKAKQEKEEAKAKKEKEEAKAKKEKEEAEAKAKEEAEAKVKKEKEEAKAKAKQEKEEAKAKKEKEEAEAKAKQEKEEAKAKKEKEEAEAKAKKEKEEAEAKAKKEKEEAEAKAKKEKEEAEAKAKKEKKEAEAKKEKEEAEARAKKEKEEAKAKKENEEAEVKAKKEKEEAEAKAKNEKEKADAKAKKEKEEAKAKKEKEEAKAKKEKEEAEAKKEKEEAEAIAKQEKEEAKAKKDKEEAEAKAKKEKEEAEAKAKQEKEEAKARKEKEEAEVKAKKEKEEAEAKEKKEAEAKKEKEEAEAKAKKEKEEAKAKKEKEEAEAIAKKEKEEAEAKAKKEKEKAEAKAKKEKEKAEAKAKKEKEEAEARKEKEEAEAKAKKEKEEAEAKAKKEKEEAEAKAKKEKEKAEAKAKKEKEEAEARKEKEEAEAKAKKEKAEAEAKAKKEKEEAKAKKEQEEAEAKAKKEKEEAKAKAKKEKEEAEMKAKKEKEEAEAKAKKEKEQAEAKAKKEKAEAEAKAKKEKEEAKAKEEQEEAEAKAKKEMEEAKAKAKKEKEEAEIKAKKEEEEAKAKKEKEEAEAKAKKEKEQAEGKSMKEKKEKEAKTKKEAEAKVKKEKEEAKAKKDNEETDAKANKEKGEGTAKKEKEENEAIAKKLKGEDAYVKTKKKEKTDEIESKSKKEELDIETQSKKLSEVDAVVEKPKKRLSKKKSKEDDKEIELLTAEHVTGTIDSKIKDTDILKKERQRKTEDDAKRLQTGKDADSEYKREENGHTEREDHYIKEYHYEPTRQTTEERTKFIDHNHRDYTTEFLRPSGYRERTFEPEKFTERDSTSLGKNATVYKAHTLVLDSQLRSSMPPSDRSESERRIDRHRSKALSEVRSLISEKRSGISRDLKRKPVFSTYLTDRTAVEGSRVKLTCSVLSSADPKITWYKNGVVLDNKLKFRTKFVDGLITLEVLNAVPGDSAEYSCTVENENGSVNSSANLKVYPSFEASPIPPTFTRSIRDTYHLAENELVLECRIRGQPLPTITWLKDDRPVGTSERHQAYYLADGVCRLAISNPTPEDSGKYTCKAENSVWSDQITHIVSFTGKESHLSPNIATIERSRFNRQALESRRPHFTNVLSDYKVAKGGTIGLQVEIRGCPTRVEWLREGLSVTELYRNAKTYVEHGLYTLALTDVTEKESGMYTCRAWSSHGNVDMNAAITVVPPNEMEGKPAIIAGRPEKDILISVGEDVNISFRVQGEPKPKVVFMKGIRDITNDQRVCKMTSDDYVKFTLKRSVVSDAGTYCILARNAYGCDRAFVTVVVRQRASSENLISDWTYPIDDSALSVAERKYKSVPDRIPGEPSVVDGGNNWVSLAWPKTDSGNTAPVLAYKIESWLIGKEGGARWIEQGITPLNSFDVFNLKQGEEYHFRVTPRNRYGWGESVQTSSPVGVGLAGDRPEFIEILPGQLKVLAGETANLSCSVKGKPLPEVLWMKNGHEIEDENRVTTAFNGHSCCLTIKDINIEDEGRYSCEATNVHGRASTYARLAVVTDRLIWEADAKLKRERSQDAVGEYPPQFTMRLRDRRVQATYPVRLTCQVIGNPPPSLTWFKDGEDVVFDNRRCKYQDEHFHTLEIAPTTLEDGGVYEAMARNSSGAVSCRCSLVVDKGIRAYVAPEFCCGLEPLYRLTEGEELRISAVVEAYPSVGVTWYRDGVRLRPSRRAIMTLDRDGQIELALASVTGRDAGVYTCTASNEVGRASTSGKVEIIEGEGRLQSTKRTPPVFINTPDVPYSKEPMFIRKPRSSEAREGDTVIIQCEVIGDPKPDVYWLRDFLKPDYYRDATHFKRVGDGPEYRFEIPHAKLDYTGAYSVVARNVHGEAKAIISLQILAKDPTSTDDTHYVRYGRVEVIPRFERELQDLLSYDGDAVEFECRVTGNPEPDIRWFHYNELIRDCPDFESSFDDGAARLKIKQVTAEDEGTYSCEACNNLGKATSSACLVVYPPGEPNTLSQRLRRPPALLSAASTPRSTPRSTPARSVSRTPGPDARRLCSPSRQMAPSFYTYPFNKVVEEGDTVTFQCAVKGQPAPWTTWDKEGIIITPSARITMKEKDDLLRILEIEHVSIEDVGIYRITVENEYGRAEASARLEVITQRGKFYAGVRAYSASPRKSLSYRRYPSSSRQD